MTGATSVIGGTAVISGTAATDEPTLDLFRIFSSHQYYDPNIVVVPIRNIQKLSRHSALIGVHSTVSTWQANR